MATRVDQPPKPRATASEPVANATLGRYRLLPRIAVGGMGEVWAAEQSGDLGFRRLVALKLIRMDHADSERHRAMFLDEAQLASRIHHANVVETLDLGNEAGQVYQVMALVDGAPLSDLVSSARVQTRDPLPLPIAVRIVTDSLQGLQAAHELCDDYGVPLGLVHRDVSPHNVLIGIDGIAKLSDFGIAKAFGRVAEESAIGHVKGKINYMAPEQVFGLPATRRSDIFSVGVVLWEALTGRPLFHENSDLDGITTRRRMEEIVPPASVARAISRPVLDVLLRALRRRPEERYGSAMGMLEALGAAVSASGASLASQQDVARCLADRLDDDLAARRELIRGARQPGAGVSGPAQVVAAPGPPPSSPRPTPMPLPPRIADAPATHTRVMPNRAPQSNVVPPRRGDTSVTLTEGHTRTLSAFGTSASGHSVPIVLGAALGLAIAIGGYLFVHSAMVHSSSGPAAGAAASEPGLASARAVASSPTLEAEPAATPTPPPPSEARTEPAPPPEIPASVAIPASAAKPSIAAPAVPAAPREPVASARTPRPRVTQNAATAVTPPSPPKAAGAPAPSASVLTPLFDDNPYRR